MTDDQNELLAEPSKPALSENEKNKEAAPSAPPAFFSQSQLQTINLSSEASANEGRKPTTAQMEVHKHPHPTHKPERLQHK